LNSRYLAKLWIISIAAAGAAFLVKLLIGGLPPLLSGSAVLAVFGFAFFLGSAALRIPYALDLLQSIHARLRRN